MGKQTKQIAVTTTASKNEGGLIHEHGHIEAPWVLYGACV